MGDCMNRYVALLASAPDRECDTGSRRLVVINQNTRVIFDLYAINCDQHVADLEVRHQGGGIDSVDSWFAFRLPYCVKSRITSLFRQRNRIDVQDEICRHQRQRYTAEQYPRTLSH